jgi:hypothetical protein
VTRSGSLLAPAPGPHQAPGTGANTDSGTHVPPRDICAAQSAFTRARDSYLIERVKQSRPATGIYDAELLAATSLDPDAYTEWLDHIWPAACTHPVRLHGDIHRVDARTGEILSTTHTSAPRSLILGSPVQPAMPEPASTPR